MTGPFQRRDIGLIVKAMVDESSIQQSTLNRLFATFDIEPVEGNREDKATHLIKSLIGEPDGQPNLRGLLNDLYWEDSKAAWRRSAAPAKELMARLGELFDIDDDGIPMPPVGSAAESPSRRLPQMPHQNRAEVQRNNVPNPNSDSNPNSVFIVHGRNKEVASELEKLLKHIGVHTLNWNRAKQLTSLPRPTTLDIVKSGLDHAKAVLVLFTPDDEAKLKDEFLKPDDGPQEVNLTGQARQNVIFEAGMAIAMASERTLLVRCGRTRTISDIDGHNWTELTNSFSERRLFVNELAKVNLWVDHDVNIMEVGSFPENNA